MKEIDLKIKTLSVEIRVLTVDGKRFTKAVFNQLLEKKIFDYAGKAVCDELVGFVIPDNTKTKWVLWTKDKILYKSKMDIGLNGYIYESGLCVRHEHHGKAVQILNDRLPDEMQIFIAI